MMDRIKQKMRHVWTYFVFGVGMSVALAAAPAQAQTYVRPSKGNTVTVLSATPPDGSVTTYTSAIYEMSAFAEVQINATLTYGGTYTYAPDTRQNNVGFLPRYIKVVTTVDRTISFRTKYQFQVFGANAPTDTFKMLPTPASYDSDAAKYATVSQITVFMTPLPYATTQYVRAMKGNPVTIRPLFPFTEDSDASQREPIIDMRGFAGVAVRVHYDNITAGQTPESSCNALAAVWMEGALTEEYDAVPGISDFNLLKYGKNYFRVATEIDDVYVFNTSVPWLRVEYYAVVVGAGVDCPVSITVVPLPAYTPTDQGSLGRGVYSNPISGSAAAYYYGNGSNMRVENIGLGAVCCYGSSSLGAGIGCFNGISAAGKRDGTSEVFPDFTGNRQGYFDCSAVTATPGTIVITTW